MIIDHILAIKKTNICVIMFHLMKREPLRYFFLSSVFLKKKIEDLRIFFIQDDFLGF